MKKSDDVGKNYFESWIQDAGHDKAPEGFRQKVMAQVEVLTLTKLERYSTPVSNSFKVAAIVLFAILAIVSMIMPESTISIFSRLGSISLARIPIPKITLPEYNFPDWIQIEYLAIGATIIILLFILDRYLGKLFRT